MPKPMLNKPQSDTRQGSLLSTAPQQNRVQNTKQMTGMELNRLLRKSRSKEYLEALHKLDSGGHVHNKQQVDEIINAIRNELPEVCVQGILLGIVSTCYLGPQYEVHTLDITGSIIEHYLVGQPMPGGLEKARSLALNGGYDFIEVYIDRCCCISPNGTVSIVEF